MLHQQKSNTIFITTYLFLLPSLLHSAASWQEPNENEKTYAESCSSLHAGNIEKDSKELSLSNIDDLKGHYCEAKAWEILNLEISGDTNSDIQFSKGNPLIFWHSAGECGRYARTIRTILDEEHSVSIVEDDCSEKIDLERTSLNLVR